MAGSDRIGSVGERCRCDVVVTRNDSKTHVSLRVAYYYRATYEVDQRRRPLPGSPFYARIYTHTPIIRSIIIGRSLVVRYQRGARGSDFCVGNGRSNKIRTPDNFRLRVISLTCPVDVGLPSSSSSSFFLFDVVVVFFFFFFSFSFSFSSSPRPPLCRSVALFFPSTAAPPRISASLTRPARSRSRDDHYFKFAPNIATKSVLHACCCGGRSKRGKKKKKTKEGRREEGPHGEKHPAPRKIAVSQPIADFDQTGKGERGKRERGGRDE